MSDSIARVLAALALAASLANTVLIVRMGGPEQPSRSARPARDGGEVVRARARAGGPADGPRVRAPGERGAEGAEGLSIAERRARWDARARTSTEVAIAAFAQAHSLSAVQQAAVLDEMLVLQGAIADVRQDMVEGQLDPTDGRAEVRALAEDSEDRMNELLGEPIATELKGIMAESWLRSGAPGGEGAPVTGD